MPFDPNKAALPGSGIFGLPHTPEEARVVLIPVPWEATVSYGGGTGRGPGAILVASRQVDLLDIETGKPYEAGIAMLPTAPEVLRWNDEAKRLAAPVIDAGGVENDESLDENIRKVDALGERLNIWVESETRKWMEAGKIVGIVGGDHSVPFGAIAAHAERYPGIGVLHFDAHADLRSAYEGFRWSHASIMANVLDRIPSVGKLVQVGIRDLCEEELDRIQGSKGRVTTFFDVDLRTRLQDGETWASIARSIVAELPRQVYVSFDIDGLDPALCPSTGTPVLGGLSFVEATRILKEVVQSGRTIVGFDLNEVAPGESEWDANVGARVLYKEIGFALLGGK